MLGGGGACHVTLCLARLHHLRAGLSSMQHVAHVEISSEEGEMRRNSERTGRRITDLEDEAYGHLTVVDWRRSRRRRRGWWWWSAFLVFADTRNNRSSAASVSVEDAPISPYTVVLVTSSQVQLWT